MENYLMSGGGQRLRRTQVFRWKADSHTTLWIGMKKIINSLNISWPLGQTLQSLGEFITFISFDQGFNKCPVPCYLRAIPFDILRGGQNGKNCRPRSQPFILYLLRNLHPPHISGGAKSQDSSKDFIVWGCKNLKKLEPYENEITD